ncbi:hypothetical protein ADUPG1_003795, partial [Aduncisulcus paluster]
MVRKFVKLTCKLTGPQKEAPTQARMLDDLPP